ncbi:hypothetical protein AB0F72_08690 [Actinoplanes sp. NPDC023936]
MFENTHRWPAQRRYGLITRWRGIRHWPDLLAEGASKRDDRAGH